MWMTEEEIRRNYHQAKYPQQQVRILADWNTCPVKDIKRILGLPLTKRDEEVKRRYVKKNGDC